MQTRGVCKQRTNDYEPANISASFISVYGRQWKFTLKLTLLQDLHHRKWHIKGKLKTWRAEKCKPGIRANNAPTATNRKTYRYPSSPYRAVSGNSCKFAAKVNPGAGFAPTEMAYQQKAKAMEG